MRCFMFAEYVMYWLKSEAKFNVHWQSRWQQLPSRIFQNLRCWCDSGVSNEVDLSRAWFQREGVKRNIVSRKSWDLVRNVTLVRYRSSAFKLVANTIMNCENSTILTLPMLSMKLLQHSHQHLCVVVIHHWNKGIVCQFYEEVAAILVVAGKTVLPTWQLRFILSSTLLTKFGERWSASEETTTVLRKLSWRTWRQ